MTGERNSIILGDCIEVMRGLPADSIDGIVTDPPYGIEFMGKEWDGANGFRRSLNAADVGRDNAFGRTSRTSPEYRGGHLFQLWTEQWAREALRVLKPGGHLLAFGGTRMYHRLAAGIEDAGFEIRDTLMWLYGSGFPKSHNLKGDWQGWGTALKPAVEPIVLARKPLIGTVAENVLAHGTGALNIDASRIATTDRFGGGAKGTGGFAAGYEGDGWVPGSDAGRWPANTLWDEEAAAQLDASTPAQPSRFFYVAKSGKHERNAGGVANIHPTVKPIALMRYLIKLVTPPGGVVLDPFLGSGTTACAAVLDGFDYIGIEQGAEYVDIARARIRHWAKQSEDQK